MRGVEDVAPYKKTQHAVRRRNVCSYRLFEKREDNILPYKKYTKFYGFTPKFVLHFVGTVRPAPPKNVPFLSTVR